MKIFFKRNAKSARVEMNVILLCCRERTRKMTDVESFWSWTTFTARDHERGCCFLKCFCSFCPVLETLMHYLGFTNFIILACWIALNPTIPTRAERQWNPNSRSLQFERKHKILCHDCKIQPSVTQKTVRELAEAADYKIIFSTVKSLAPDHLQWGV